MQASLTVRQSARDVGVHRNTSFRWRHRFLAWSKNDRPKHLHGITEADETYFLESSKGARIPPLTVQHCLLFRYSSNSMNQDPNRLKLT